MHPTEKEWTRNEMNKLLRYLMKIGASQEDAKDIVQETFYKALLYADVIPANKRTAWLYRVAINSYYDLYKMSKRTTAFPSSVEFTSSEGIPEAHLIADETQKDVLEVLEELSPAYKRVLELRYKEDMSYKEIGESLDMKTNTVRTYLSRAKKQFAKLYRRFDKYE